MILSENVPNYHPGRKYARSRMAEDFGVRVVKLLSFLVFNAGNHLLQ